MEGWGRGRAEAGPELSQEGEGCMRVRGGGEIGSLKRATSNGRKTDAKAQFLNEKKKYAMKSVFQLTSAIEFSHEAIL